MSTVLRDARSALFPYTTLFRSHVLPQAMRVLTDPADCGPVTLCLPQDVRSEETRLNSSHANTSYAVFCLKKKITPARVSVRHPCLRPDASWRHITTRSATVRLR